MPTDVPSLQPVAPSQELAALTASYVTFYVLAAMRVLGAIAFNPLLGSARVPMPGRVGIGLFATLVLFPVGGPYEAPASVGPLEVAAVEVKPDGDVIARSPEGDLQTIGKLRLVRFENPEGLQQSGGNAVLPTVASGAPIEGQASEVGIGTVVSGIIETSNIDTREEYLRIVQAQRAYELNVRAMKTMDEMLQDANNLRRQ